MVKVKGIEHEVWVGNWLTDVVEVIEEDERNKGKKGKIGYLGRNGFSDAGIEEGEIKEITNGMEVILEEEVPDEVYE